MTGQKDFSYKHAVAWVRHDFKNVKQCRFLDTVNSYKIVFPKCTPLQHNKMSFKSFEDLEGRGCYYEWDFYCLEKVEITDPD